MSHVASGSYIRVALAVRSHARNHADAAVLIFDDTTGRQIDFDLSGTADEVSARLSKRFPAAGDDVARAPGRPKLGVVAREVTLLPHHWEWLAEQPGGASVTLRKLIEDARRAPLSDKARVRKLHERTYGFMSAIAGDLPDFEEASRALFANDMTRFKHFIAEWPRDIRKHLDRLCRDDLPLNQPK